LRYIFLDESGDLGFSAKSSKYFIVAALCTKEEKIVNRCIKTVRTGLSKKYKKTEMKFSNSSNPTRRRVLKCIAGKNISISYISLKKEWIYHYLRDKQPIIHNYMIGQLLSNILYCASVIRTTIIIDKFLPYKKIEGFNKYIDFKTPVRIEVEHQTSHGNNGLQAVDFVAGAIHKKYRDNKESFYNIISDKIDISLNSREKIFRKKISDR